MTHTPAQWGFEKDSISDSFFEITTIENGEKYAVASVYGGEANARLIACAPELLKALEEMISALSEQRIKAISVGGMSVIVDKGTMAFHNARAAIVKAKGESC